VSYISKKKDNCYNLKIISADLNEKYLDFEIFYETLNCISTKNKHGYWAHQGAGGRIFKIDNSSILFTTGDFRNRPMAQKLDSEFGKILRINITTKKAEVVSLGHRNPQGLFYSKKFDFILSTEHGPKGGDEININHKPFLMKKNFGWPISSYGEHYAKHYSKDILSEAPLKKSHKKYGFEEPIKYFVPSIGISELVSISNEDREFFIGAMGNQINDQDLGIHYIKLNKKRDKIVEHKYIMLNERVRDMVISKNKKTIIMFLETSSSIIILKK
jgi:glucose/arabinose dehydrogenase